MIYLLVKEKSKKQYRLYCPNIFGIETWGSTSQDSLVKKKKYWYIHHWSAGSDWIDDINESYKLNVVMETSDLDAIIRYVAIHNEKEIEHLYKDARVIYNKYLDMCECFHKNY